eukprot:COSAG01_NODE_1602_length_9759_cov_35.078157_2_plen_115_part_00
MHLFHLFVLLAARQLLNCEVRGMHGGRSPSHRCAGARVRSPPRVNPEIPPRPGKRVPPPRPDRAIFQVRPFLVRVWCALSQSQIHRPSVTCIFRRASLSPSLTLLHTVYNSLLC